MYSSMLSLTLNLQTPGSERSFPLDLTLGSFIWQADRSGMQTLCIFDVRLMLSRILLWP